MRATCARRFPASRSTWRASARATRLRASRSSWNGTAARPISPRSAARSSPVARSRMAHPWRVGLENPVDEALVGPALRTPPDARTAVVTSGSYRHYLDAAGRRFGHIIDPRTGRPVEHALLSVTVVGPDAAEAAAWGTALLCLGPAAATGGGRARGTRRPVLDRARRRRRQLGSSARRSRPSGRRCSTSRRLARASRRRLKYQNGSSADASISTPGQRIAERPVQLGHDVEIHAVDRGDQRRRQEHARRDRENLDDVALLDVDHAERRIEQERDFLRDERRVVAQRLEIMLERSHAPAQFLAVGSIGEHLSRRIPPAAAARAGKRECSSTDRPCGR